MLSEGTVRPLGDGLGASDSLGSSLGSVSVGSGSLVGLSLGEGDSPPSLEASVSAGGSLGSSEPDSDSSSDPLSLGASLSSSDPLSLGASELVSLVGELVLSEGSSSESPVQAVKPPSSSPTVRMWAAVRVFVMVTLPVVCPSTMARNGPGAKPPAAS